MQQRFFSYFHFSITTVVPGKHVKLTHPICETLILFEARAWIIILDLINGCQFLQRDKLRTLIHRWLITKHDEVFRCFTGQWSTNLSTIWILMYNDSTDLCNTCVLFYESGWNSSKVRLSQRQCVTERFVNFLLLLSLLL